MDPITILSWTCLVVAIAASIIFAFSKRKFAQRKIHLFIGSYNFFCGLLFCSLSAGHFLFISSEPFLGRTLSNEVPFTYNFRFYSLLLLGGINFFLGFNLINTSFEIVKGNEEKFRRTIKILLWLLLVNIPLAPIQGFAVAFSIFAIIDLIALILIKVRRLNR